MIDKEIKKIVTKLIRMDARSEALEILEKASESQMKEFLDYWNKKQENICCLVLDSIKIDLVKSGQMTKGENDNFGMYDYFGEETE
jgi:hypothetical protein